jgi:hypothetical protein
MRCIPARFVQIIYNLYCHISLPCAWWAHNEGQAWIGPLGYGLNLGGSESHGAASRESGYIGNSWYGEGRRREMDSEEYMNRKSTKQRSQRLVYSCSPQSGASPPMRQSLPLTFLYMLSSKEIRKRLIVFQSLGKEEASSECPPNWL